MSLLATDPPAPEDLLALRLLEGRVIGRRLTEDSVTPEQLDAVRLAVALQVAYTAALPAAGRAGTFTVPGYSEASAELTFAETEARRVCPAGVDLLAFSGLIVRSGSAKPTPEDA